MLQLITRASPQMRRETADFKLTEDRILNLRERLNEVDSKRVDGRFVGDDGDFAPKGQAVLVSLLEQCYTLVSELDRMTE